ncbi:MAG: flavin reductase family protein, partial [Anaerolineae bacterium]|nr:flavin reductase family protein [Anaerolineae bacterium]
PSLEVKPARVAGAAAAFECRAVQIIPVPGSSYTMVLGQVLRYHLQDGLLREDGTADPLQLHPVARLGGSEYAELGKIYHLARP